MDAIIDWLLGFMVEKNNVLGLAIIAGSAMTEYVFPPFPGDTVTLFGAILITAYGWSFAAVFGAVMTGAVAGSMLMFYVGRWLEERREARHARLAHAQASGRTTVLPDQQARRDARRARLDRLIEKFHRHGAAYLVLGRFLPGIRALFLLAAGMARMPTHTVLFYSALSAALWNLAVIALGSLLGASFDSLLAWVRRYTTATWLILAGVAIVLIARTLYQRHRPRKSSRGIR